MPSPSQRVCSALREAVFDGYRQRMVMGQSPGANLPRRSGSKTDTDFRLA
jgi:hypothetical protein